MGKDTLKKRFSARALLENTSMHPWLTSIGRVLLITKRQMKFGINLISAILGDGIMEQRDTRFQVSFVEVLEHTKRILHHCQFCTMRI
jgi:hypothetical protein